MKIKLIKSVGLSKRYCSDKYIVDAIKQLEYNEAFEKEMMGSDLQGVIALR